MDYYQYNTADDYSIGMSKMNTDIASGNNAGVTTVCVLSGEVTLEEVEKSTGVEKPDYLLESVSKLLK